MIPLECLTEIYKGLGGMGNIIMDNAPFPITYASYLSYMKTGG